MTAANDTGSSPPPAREARRGNAADHLDDIVYPSAIPFIVVHLACLGGVLDRRHLAGAGALRRALLAAHLRDRRRLSPLFLPPLVFHQPGLPVRAGLPRPDHGAEQRALVGRACTATIISIPTPSTTRIRRASAASSTPTSAGSSTRRHDKTDLVQVADLAASRSWCGCIGSSWRPPSLSRVALLPDRRLVRPGGRLPLEHRAGLPRHLLHQLAGPRARQAALRDRRRLPQQLAAGALHHGRGLAQQSPRLPEQRAPGFPLVGGATPPLHPARALLDRPGLGPEDAAADVLRNEQRLGARVSTVRPRSWPALQRRPIAAAVIAALEGASLARLRRRWPPPSIAPASVLAGPSPAAAADPRRAARPRHRHVRQDALDRRHRRPRLRARPRRHRGKASRTAGAGLKARAGGPATGISGFSPRTHPPRRGSFRRPVRRGSGR